MEEIQIRSNHSKDVEFLSQQNLYRKGPFLLEVGGCTIIYFNFGNEP